MHLSFVGMKIAKIIPATVACIPDFKTKYHNKKPMIAKGAKLDISFLFIPKQILRKI